MTKCAVEGCNETMIAICYTMLTNRVGWGKKGDKWYYCETHRYWGLVEESDGYASSELILNEWIF
jgi:hypothetical protein